MDKKSRAERVAVIEAELYGDTAETEAEKPAAKKPAKKPAKKSAAKK